MLLCAAGAAYAPWLFSKGRAAGFNTFRFFALGDNNDDRFAKDRLNYALQPQPGESSITAMYAYICSSEMMLSVEM